MRTLKRSILNSAAIVPVCAALALGAAPNATSTQLEAAVQLFDEHRLDDSMNAFLQVLRGDPNNERAHAYVDLITKELSIQRRALIREKQLEMLSDTSNRLDNNRRDPSTVQQAIEDMTHAEDRARQERWHGLCEQARIQMQMGHLLQSNDLTLKILGENPSFAEAQRLLSDLQSRIRQTLDHSTDLSIQERYALQGFYAYGQADYANALAGWEKARALIAQSYTPADASRRIDALRFEPYERIAQAEVDQAKHRAELDALFNNGVALDQKARYLEALDVFRRVAIQEPDYPQLGRYLVQTEADAEQERARRLGERKRQQVAQAVQDGLSELESEHYQKAAENFETALKLDPSHPQARSYLLMARAEMERRHDPKAAQMHYETGLVAYASGKLEDAIREWKIAVRMDPQHVKAKNALVKAQKELALDREAP